MLDKFEIARALREIGQLLELKGENAFKVKAYDNGAEALENMADDLGQTVEERRLTNLRGIGEALAAKISELYQTGRCEFLEELRAQMPPGVLELSQIPGLSTKKIQALQSALNITSIGELQMACKAGLVAGVPGFGKKTEEKILAGIQTYERREDRVLLLDAQAIGEKIIAYLKENGVEKAELAGSLRRWQETIGDINVVVLADDAQAALDTFENFPAVTKLEERTADSARVRLASGIRADVLVASKATWFAALHQRTGSAGHYDGLKALAKGLGIQLSEHGIGRQGKLVGINSENDIYEVLGLPYVPPELREDIGEIEKALKGESFDDLISIEDVQGMVHCHSTFSDGRNSVEEMVMEAERLGMKYITMTDHSPSAHYAGGLDDNKMQKQWQEIARVQQKVKLKILRGTESDILEDGSLDYSDKILNELDIVIASVHSRMKMDEDEMTKRLVACMKKEQFKIWGHALGRLVLKREPFKCRVEEVLDAIAESRAAVEINGDPYRLDMEPKWLRKARERGIKFVISVDAHSVQDLHNLRFGIHMARRAGIRKEEVLNTLPLEEFMAKVKPAAPASVS
ncbi:MAG TPA: DNA polymerase/3'-5' exonuclease PolX [Planktothrix sp.]